METTIKYSRAVIILFLLLSFGLMALTLAAPKRSFSEKENRVLAERPELTIEKLLQGTFMTEYEAYLTDQFFLRDEWIWLKTWTELLLGKREINGVYIGSDGYLIEHHAASEIDADMLERSQTYLIRFAERYAGLLGAEHLKVMLVPTASELLTEKLPAFAEGFDQDGMIESIYERLPEGTALDVRGILREHADEYIYYKTDHHWTTLGAFFAYQAYCAAMGLPVPELAAAEQRVVSEEFLGTVYSKLNVAFGADTMYQFVLPDTPTQVQMTVDKEKTWDTLYNEAYLGQKDKYSYYLDGNHGLTEITSDGDGKGRLLIIKDSYSHCFAPMLLGNYEAVYLVDFRYFHMPISQFIAENQVTDVLVLYNAVTFATDTHTGAFVR